MRRMMTGLAVLAGVLAMGGTAMAAPRAAAAHPAPRASAGDAAAIAELANDPKYGPVWRDLQATYPGQMNGLLEAALAARRSGTPWPQVKREFMAKAAELWAADLPEAAKAPSAELQAYSHAYGELFRAMRAAGDIKGCAGAAMGTMSNDEASNIYEVDTQMIALVRSLLAAIRAARAHPTVHGAVTAPDVMAMVETMHGTGAPGFAPADLRGLTSAPPAVQCDTGIAMMEALAVMEPEGGGRFLAAILPGMAANLRDPNRGRKP